MAPGTWNAPGNEHTVALASGFTYRRRSQVGAARRRSADVSYWPAVCLGQGE
jgi:hypothetical protein